MDATAQPPCQMVANAGHNSLILCDRERVSFVPWHTERRGSVRRPAVPAGGRDLSDRHLRSLFAFDALTLPGDAKNMAERPHFGVVAAGLGEPENPRRAAGSGDGGFVLL